MNTEYSSSDVHIAKALALKFHAGQLYGDQSYHVHLQQVYESVKKGTTDERMLIVAWLHDILEDTKCTPQVLSSLFEDNVVDAVKAITRWTGMSKEDYLRQVKTNHMARLVKIHDSLCNLKASVMRFDAKRIKKYTEQIAFLASQD